MLGVISVIHEGFSDWGNKALIILIVERKGLEAFQD
jgi:hypothetical protein